MGRTDEPAAKVRGPGAAEDGPGKEWVVGLPHPVDQLMPRLFARRNGNRLSLSRQAVLLQRLRSQRACNSGDGLSGLLIGADEDLRVQDSLGHFLTKHA